MSGSPACSANTIKQYWSNDISRSECVEGGCPLSFTHLPTDRRTILTRKFEVSDVEMLFNFDKLIDDAAGMAKVESNKI